MLWDNSSGKTLFQKNITTWIIKNISDKKAKAFMIDIAMATTEYNKEWFGVSVAKYPDTNRTRSRILFRKWQEDGYIRYKKGHNGYDKHGKRPPLFALGMWIFEVKKETELFISENGNKTVKTRTINNIRNTIKEEEVYDEDKFASL